MRLTDKEFNAMNTGTRRFFQRRLEFPVFQSLGLTQTGADILEVGCGSGYGAELLMRLRPRSYLGFDLMPEQIELARQRRLPGAEFLPGDATCLDWIPSASKDVVVIFGILHHIPEWRRATAECARVLRPGGWLFVEEPDGGILQTWERVFHWGHPGAGSFRLAELEAELRRQGFEIRGKRALFGFASYGARKSA